MCGQDYSMISNNDYDTTLLNTIQSLKEQFPSEKYHISQPVIFKFKVGEKPFIKVATATRTNDQYQVAFQPSNAEVRWL